MSLSEYYNSLYKDSLEKIKSDEYQIDSLIDSPFDKRYGITLLARINRNVKDEIQKFLNELKIIEPEQYYYPDSDLHITVMSIISCYNGFQLSNIPIEKYVRIIQKSISGLSRFNIKFKGLTASPSCLMVQGFVEDDTLYKIRNNLRLNFVASGLEQSIDKRYTIQTAHSTIFRLRKQFRNKEAFIKKVEAYRDYDFGAFTVNILELVYNDWHQRKEHVKTLCEFELK
jgi:2'-5' RNA ligase